MSNSKWTLFGGAEHKLYDPNNVLEFLVHIDQKPVALNVCDVVGLAPAPPDPEMYPYSGDCALLACEGWKEVGR